MSVRCLVAWRTCFLVVVWLLVPSPLNAEGPRQPSTSRTASQPNVVIFLSDDQGFGDFGVTGNRDLKTPHLDRLAASGALLENFFVCPVCSPTRAEFLTGRYHPRGGVFSTSTGGERLDLDETTLAQVFQQAGYATGAFGKWHNGMQPPYHPNARGFETFYGFCSGHWGHYFGPMLERDNQIVQGNGFVIDDFTDQALSFIEQHRDQPFLVYLPYCTPHSPMQVPAPYWDRFRDKPITQSSSNAGKEVLSHTRAALAMCENLDDNVGRVLARLDEWNLANDTIVIYFCDNGPNGWRYNAGLKGRKGSTDEGGVRSPLFVRWPGRIPAGHRPPQIAGAIDLLPTLVELCGIEWSPPKPLDGLSIAADLRGESEERDRSIFSHWGGKVSVRTNRFRLDDKGRLFDMRQDPGQARPVENQPLVAQQLQQAVADWKRQVLSELDRDQEPFPVGHPNFVRTQLPARDAQATGRIERSSQHPNCSFFRNWVDTADTIRWPIEVLTPGRYQVDLYYTCRPENVGTVIALSCGEHRIVRKINLANDPPLVGAAEDRSPRTESLVKDFRPVDLGNLDLSAGRGELILRAVEIPGSESIEFRLLVLKRIE